MSSSDASSFDAARQNVIPIWVAPSAQSSQFWPSFEAKLRNRHRRMLEAILADEPPLAPLLYNETFHRAVSERLYQYWRAGKLLDEDDTPHGPDPGPILG
ncbi:MAG: hypothetical protein VKJ06_04990 [Vampirovibrionales bacterium]|nr:hypothetical protein [Vampirovibrionales bacterium]